MQLFGKAPHAGVVAAPERESVIARAGFEITKARGFEGAPHSRFVVARKP
ncbi:MAG: hypothetical protein LJE68_15275 [Rhodobacter sp.]|nr:hypothetical protein [Rhodobacter sp.]